MRSRLRINSHVSVSTRTKVMLRSAAIGIVGGVMAASLFFVCNKGVDKFKEEAVQTETMSAQDSLRAMTTLEPK